MTFHVGPLSINFEPRAIHRPYVGFDWYDNRTFGLTAGWGSRYSDPTLGLCLTVELDDRLGRLVDRWYARKEAR